MWKYYPMEEDFQSYFSDLVKNRNLTVFDYGKGYGITLQVIDKGINSLSSKQRYVFFNEVFKDFAVEECSFCGDSIPWCEMDVAMESGMCGWCNHMTEKHKTA